MRPACHHNAALCRRLSDLLVAAGRPTTSAEQHRLGSLEKAFHQAHTAKAPITLATAHDVGFGISLLRHVGECQDGSWAGSKLVTKAQNERMATQAAMLKAERTAARAALHEARLLVRRMTEEEEQTKSKASKGPVPEASAENRQPGDEEPQWEDVASAALARVPPHQRLSAARQCVSEATVRCHQLSIETRRHDSISELLQVKTTLMLYDEADAIAARVADIAKSIDPELCVTATGPLKRMSLVVGGSTTLLISKPGMGRASKSTNADAGADSSATSKGVPLLVLNRLVSALRSARCITPSITPHGSPLCPVVDVAWVASTAAMPADASHDPDVADGDDTSSDERVDSDEAISSSDSTVPSSETSVETARTTRCVHLAWAHDGEQHARCLGMTATAAHSQRLSEAAERVGLSFSADGLFDGETAAPVLCRSDAEVFEALQLPAKPSVMW